MSSKSFRIVWNKNRNTSNVIQPENRCISRTLTTHQVHPNILVSGSTDVNIPNVTITQFIFPKLGNFDKYTATKCSSTGRSYTFGQILSKSRNLSKALRCIFKLEKGDVVAIFLPNRAEYAIAVLGSLDAGLTSTTLNIVYTPIEISKQLLDSSTKLIITQSQSVRCVKAALEIMKTKLPIVAIKSSQSEGCLEGIIDFEELTTSNLDIHDVYVKPSDLAFLPYSSGTTGLPKGVELTHANIISNICQVGHEDYNYHSPPTDSYQDVTPAVLPFSHIYGLLRTVLVTLKDGVKTVTLDKFLPELYVSALKNNPISIIYAAPPLVLFLASCPLVKSEYFKHVKLLTSGAAPLGFSDEERLLKKIGNQKTKLIQGYGLTETSPIVTYTPKNIKKTEDNGGTVGKPLPNTLVKIVAPDDISGTPLGPNEKGELLLKGPQVMRGYHKREEETKNTFLDGWLKTGDIAYYNNDKLVFIADRLKELIKVKGFQVAPAELEEIVRNHSSVQDVAVIGVPHTQYGEVPRAYIVLKKNSSVNVEDIKTYVDQKVVKYKELTGGVQVVDCIPKTASGKILRRQLKMNYINKGY